MKLTRIVCSNCGYTKEIPESTLPQQRVNVTCPQCKNVFVFDPINALRQETPVNTSPRQSPNPFSKNKIAEDLIVRVDQARTRNKTQSDTEGVNSNIAVQNVQKIQYKNEFALEKNTAALAALLIMASMLVYALVDTVFFNLYEIVGYPDNKSLIVVLSAMPICLLGIVIYRYMIRSSVPERETIVLTILCVISLAVAAHPLLQRIDTIIASKPMQTYNYRMIKQGVFEPVEVGTPKLNLRTQCEYWQQYTVNTLYQISLQHGGLGMWQLDGEALDKDIYAYLKKIHPSNFIGNLRIK